MKTRTYLFCLMIVATTFFAACTPGTADTDLEPDAATSAACTGMGLVDVTEDITAPTTWETNTVYVIRKWDFYVESTLTIEPGTIIKFTTYGPDMTLGGDGVIVAEGTDADPIVFTSFKDDTQGCDNNGDGAITAPASRDWGSIDTNGLISSIFDHCAFYYGGDSAYSATLALSAGSRAQVTNSIFAHNDGSDGSGWYGALDASSAIAGTVITGNTFYDNVRPLSVSVDFDVDDSNVFHNPDDATETNTYNGILVESINHITSNISWEETEVPFVIDDNDFWINSGATLTLGADVALKFRPDSVLLLQDGTSQLITDSADGQGGTVVFTSYRDDTVKGDTNADGTATTPAEGDWGGIYDDTAEAPYYLNWSNIYYDEAH